MSNKVYAVSIGEFFEPAKAFQTPAAFINRILPNVYLLAGIILFILVIGAGFMLIRGASEGEADQVGMGKQAATYAVIGFLLIFASFWIIRLVEAITGISILGGG